MLREATVHDMTALRDLEREANLAALGHVFPPERYPFPDDDVLARWAILLDDPAVTVLVDETEDGVLDVLAAYDDRSLRHLAVRSTRWGEGLASQAVEAVLRAIAATGADEAELWCLEENKRARRLYEHLGWRVTSDRREGSWPPHPTMLRYVCPLRQGVG
jgi:RimJ/RimL family protein N-acetyltransferase